MSLSQIKERAKAMGIKPEKQNKQSLIRAIQEAEGNTACFGGSKGNCLLSDCCWMEDCA